MSLPEHIYARRDTICGDDDEDHIYQRDLHDSLDSRYALHDVIRAIDVICTIELTRLVISEGQ